MNFEAFDNSAKQYLSFLDNEYTTMVISLLLVLYASVYAPRLPYSVVQWMEHPVVRGVLFFLIVYLSKKTPSTALIVSVSVLVVLSILSRAGSEHMTDLAGCGYGCGCGASCNFGKTCPRQGDCPCHKMRHQYASYEPFEQETNQTVTEETTKQTVTEEPTKHAVISEIKQEIQPVKVEEAKVNAVIAKVEEKKKEIGRDLSAEELKLVCNDVTKRFETLPPVNDEFDEESLSALREKVAHRQQNTVVSGFDGAQVFASL